MITRKCLKGRRKKKFYRHQKAHPFIEFKKPLSPILQPATLDDRRSSHLDRSRRLMCFLPVWNTSPISPVLSVLYPYPPHYRTSVLSSSPVLIFLNNSIYFAVIESTCRWTDGSLLASQSRMPCSTCLCIAKDCQSLLSHPTISPHCLHHEFPLLKSHLQPMIMIYIITPLCRGESSSTLWPIYTLTCTHASCTPLTHKHRHIDISPVHILAYSNIFTFLTGLLLLHYCSCFSCSTHDLLNLD